MASKFDELVKEKKRVTVRLDTYKKVKYAINILHEAGFTWNSGDSLLDMDIVDNFFYDYADYGNVIYMSLYQNKKVRVCGRKNDSDFMSTTNKSYALVDILELEGLFHENVVMF